MLTSELLNSSLQGTDVVPTPAADADPSIELVDLTLQSVLAIDQLGARRPIPEPQPSPDETHHAPDGSRGHDGTMIGAASDAAGG